MVHTPSHCGSHHGGRSRVRFPRGPDATRLSLRILPNTEQYPGDMKWNFEAG